MLNWAAVVCCWKFCVPGSIRACINDEHQLLLWMCLSFTIAFFGGMPLTRVDRYRAPPNPVLWYVGGLWLRCARIFGSGLFVGRGSCHTCVKRTSTVTNRLERCGQSIVPRAVWERHVPPLRAMDEILHGTIWSMISPLVTTDDVVRCRTVTTGKMGEFHFEPQQNDPYEKHWHYDSDGNKTYTMLKKNDPFTELFRRWGLHGPKEAASSSGARTTETSSLGDAVISLIADARIRQLSSTRCTPRQWTTLIRCLRTWEKCGVKVVPRVRSGRVSWSWVPLMKMKRETTRVRRTTMKTKVWRTISNK